MILQNNQSKEISQNHNDDFLPNQDYLVEKLMILFLASRIWFSEMPYTSIVVYKIH